MENFLASCEQWREYPTNLLPHNTFRSNEKAYLAQLRERESRIFCGEKDAFLNILDQTETDKGFERYSCDSVSKLAEILNFGSAFGHDDKRCRYIFVHARNSRDRLRCTKDMALTMLTYYQIFPAFLDFLFTFGNQEYQEGFHFGGFRSDSSLSALDKGISIPELDRSGFHVQLCYMLRSVEPAAAYSDLPWSIRQTAVYQSLDLKTGYAVWLIVKGNNVIRDRINAMVKPNAGSEAASARTASLSDAFKLCLDTHISICNWSAESWAWYISHLEQQLQQSTRTTLSAKVSQDLEGEASWQPLPTVSEKAPTRSSSRSWSFSKRALTENSIGSSFSPLRKRWLKTSPTFSETSQIAPNPVVLTSQEEFSFDDLQRVHFLEEKTNEVLLVLKMNESVYIELERTYGAAHTADCIHQDNVIGLQVHFGRFVKHLQSIRNELHLQQARAETLLSLIAQRRTLLHGILEYRNMEASRSLAQRTQSSTDQMNDLTRKMHEIARKTQRETVSMRIITLVTLFFLPGTFISTIMSTDIIRFDDSMRMFSLEALQLYLVITVPLMAFTFAGWYGVYWWERKKEIAPTDEAFHL